ncbi:MAG: 16S rRNA (guanine(966)-N(2))-methyltransferase RsmD [Oscillospiraceae bacterium]
MRVITGSARGSKLKTLDSLDVRPTPDMVKEAIFSIIQFDIPASSVLDLFAGSGQLGIEALSRGAEHCVFVEKNRAAYEIVNENLEHCHLKGNSRVLLMDSLEYLRVAKKGFDIALLDPPYRNGLIEKALPLLESKMNENGIVVCEHEKELELEDQYGSLQFYRRYKYGKIAVTVFKKNETEEGSV